MLGYDKPLYLMAFDHRGSFEHDLFGAAEPVSAQVRDGIIAVKEIIFDAHRQALAARAPRSASGVLVDEEFGAGVARRAKSDCVPLAMPVETLWEQALKDFLAGSGETPAAASSSAAADGGSR